MYTIAKKFLFFKNYHLTKTGSEHSFLIFRHDEILLIRIEVFMINKKYHVTNFLINDQSMKTFINQ
jgi:hypothetical protein